MPKQTFFNLPEDKRERILEAVIDEFAEYYYHKASITRIVKNAGIAKGSFYQYFDDKKDLFKYLIEKIGEMKLKFLYPVMNDFDKMDFFQIIRELYIAGIKFGIENPRLQDIADNFTKDNDMQLREEILGNAIPKSNAMMVSLVKKGIENGDIDPNIDIPLTASIITSLSITVSNYFIKEINSQDYMEIMPFVDKMLNILKNGISNKRREKND